MTGRVDGWLRQPLLAERPASDNRRARWILLLVWLAITLAIAVNHVPWRDEARAWSLTLMGGSWPDMFRTVQGEGHPYLWYILLRAGHDLFGAPEVLRVTGLVIGIAAVALLVLRGPFRMGMLALLIFSLHLGFEYTVLARNYGISALIMLVIAAFWPQIRDSLWLGVLLLLLCNTNVPSVFLAGSFAFYRMIELYEAQPSLKAAEWRRWSLQRRCCCWPAPCCAFSPSIRPPTTVPPAPPRRRSPSPICLALCSPPNGRSWRSASGADR